MKLVQEIRLAMQCDQCGATLPRENARFCANCGAAIISREAQPAPSPDGDDATRPAPPPKRELKKPLREQRARQPSAFSAARTSEGNLSGDKAVREPTSIREEKQAQASSDDKQLESDRRASDTMRGEPLEAEPAAAQPLGEPSSSREVASPPGVVKPRRAPVTRDFERTRRSDVQWPTPVTHTALTENAQQSTEAPAEGSHGEPLVSPEPDASLAPAMKASPIETPKRELHVKVWRQPDTPAAPASQVDVASPVSDDANQAPSSVPALASANDTENQPTRPLGPSETPLQSAASAATPVAEREDRSPSLEQIDTLQLSAQPQPAPASSRSQSRRTPPVGRPRRPLVLLAIVVPLLVIASLILWIALAQPFSVSPVTQPWQSYSDPSLGMSFVYPNDWSRQVDRNKSIVQLNDSSHTAQVTVAVANANSGSLSQFAQQQAKQFGLTTTKAAPTLSFGGATWQQLQGNTQISGANYSGRVLATTHGSHHYVIVQLAPLDTYSDEEKVIFTPMHASWKFHT